MNNLSSLRNKIDLLDDKIMSLLNERFTISKQIGIIKQKTNTAILNKKREQDILNKISCYQNKKQITNVYNTILEESKKLQ